MAMGTNGRRLGEDEELFLAMPETINPPSKLAYRGYTSLAYRGYTSLAYRGYTSLALM
jgi:hypothetical protein